MSAREPLLTRAQVQEMVDEAVAQDRDVYEYVRGKIDVLDLPEMINVGGEMVPTVDHIMGDIEEYKRGGG
jgi:hypothetical protein